jgi:8-oxo-dGTP pyrophosphatase MutT (NUDIX family)
MRGATVLLLNTRSTGKYQLPGGGVETGERIEDALRREVREETGIEVEVERFLGFKEDFFYYDPWDEAYHSLLFSMRADRSRSIWPETNRSRMGKPKSPNG